jgi:hypothetical protein
MAMISGMPRKTKDENWKNFAKGVLVRMPKDVYIKLTNMLHDESEWFEREKLPRTQEDVLAAAIHEFFMLAMPARKKTLQARIPEVSSMGEKDRIVALAAAAEEASDAVPAQVLHLKAKRKANRKNVRSESK